MRLRAALCNKELSNPKGNRVEAEKAPVRGMLISVNRRFLEICFPPKLSHVKERNGASPHFMLWIREKGKVGQWR